MLDAANAFLAAHARVLDRRRFERLFEGGPAEPVRTAVAAYANPDGGFGHALEPDGRAPGQPARRADAGAAHAARGRRVGRRRWPPARATGSCRSSRTAAASPFVLPVDRGLAGRAVVAGAARAARVADHDRPDRRRRCWPGRVEHPWVERAVGWLWDAAEAAEGEYDLRGAVAFLNEAPDRERAHAALRALAPRLAAAGLGPLDVAPLPGQPGRVLYDDAQVAAALDELAAGQRADGGWDFAWPAWSPAAQADWRGSITVDALAVLRANGAADGEAASLLEPVRRRST